MIKTPSPRKFMEERVYLSWWFLRMRGYHARAKVRWQKEAENSSWISARKQRGSGSWKPSLNDSLPPSRFHPPPQISPNSTPTGDQAFNYLDYQGHFSFKPSHFYKTTKTLKIERKKQRRKTRGDGKWSLTQSQRQWGKQHRSVAADLLPVTAGVLMSWWVDPSLVHLSVYPQWENM